MNGEYKFLKDYIIPERIEKCKLEYKEAMKKFKERYEDIVINSFISTIKTCDMKKIWMTKVWVLSYEFNAADIEALDKENPNNSKIMISKFFEESICSVLKLTPVEATFGRLSEDKTKVLYLFKFKNPIFDDVQNYIPSSMKE